MITCPKCKQSNNIIAEQPNWSNEKDGEYIEIQSHCVECGINFTSLHKIGRMLKVYDIEEDYKYTY